MPDVGHESRHQAFELAARAIAAVVVEQPLLERRERRVEVERLGDERPLFGQLSCPRDPRRPRRQRSGRAEVSSAHSRW